MEIAIALVAVGLGALAWRQRRRLPTALAAPAFDEDAEIALAVARHEARSRSQPLAPIHVLYGLVQSQQITDAVVQLGGDGDKLVDRVLAALDRAPANPQGEQLVAYAAAIAHGHGRPASCADLWSVLTMRSGASPIDDAEISTASVLFVLAHGRPEPAIANAAAMVDVILHNDDFTRMEVVVAILRDVFELDESLAMTRMREAHQVGRATIGRLSGAIAAQRIAAAHARARADGYPLRFEAVPV